MSDAWFRNFMLTLMGSNVIFEHHNMNVRLQASSLLNINFTRTHISDFRLLNIRFQISNLVFISVFHVHGSDFKPPTLNIKLSLTHDQNHDCHNACGIPDFMTSWFAYYMIHDFSKSWWTRKKNCHGMQGIHDFTISWFQQSMMHKPMNAMAHTGFLISRCHDFSMPWCPTPWPS